MFKKIFNYKIHELNAMSIIISVNSPKLISSFLLFPHVEVGGDSLVITEADLLIITLWCLENWNLNKLIDAKCTIINMYSSYVKKISPYLVALVCFVENVIIVDWLVVGAVAVERIAVGGLILDQPARDLLKELLNSRDHDILDVAEGGLVLVHHRVRVKVTAQDDKVCL